MKDQRVLIVSLGDNDLLAHLLRCLDHMEVSYEVMICARLQFIGKDLWHRLLSFRPTLIHVVSDDWQGISSADLLKSVRHLMIFSQIMLFNKICKKPLCATSSGKTWFDRLLAISGQGIEISDLAHRARLRRFNENVVWQVRNRDNCADDANINQLSRYYAHVVKTN